MAIKDLLDGAVGSTAMKVPVRCATTANITLSGFQDIDGVTLASGDENLRVLVKSQTDTTENGLWDAQSGDWTRCQDFDGNRDVAEGTLIRINEGALSARWVYAVTTADPIVIGASALSFARVPELGGPGRELFIEDFGAAGDGVTSDHQAFSDMLSATGGWVNLQDKEYLIGTQVITGYTQVKITGPKKPKVKNDFSQLEDGAILIGEISITAYEVYLSGWGLDSGSARSISVSDGLVCNAVATTNGDLATIENIAACGPTEAGTTHSILVQGYERNYARNIYMCEHQFGLVVKGRNAVISDIDSDNIRTAAVYPKSDIPAYAGGVGDGTVKTAQIDNVKLRASASNTTASAVYIHASTAALSSVQINNVDQAYGLSPVRIQGGALISDPTISDIQITNIKSELAQSGFFTGGYTYDWQATNIEAVNPVLGQGVSLDTNSFGYTIDCVHVIISDLGNTTTNCGTLQGYGMWDNYSVRNPARTMTINIAAGSLGSIICGSISGDVVIENDGSLASDLINGAVADTVTPTLNILKGSVLQLTGRVDLSSSANQFFCNLPVTTGKEMAFACGASVSSSITTVAVRLNSFQLSVEPSLPAGIDWVDLSNITVQL